MLNESMDNQQAVILHQYNYRNSSLIVHFFLSGHGKVSAVARGVKGSRGQSKSAAKKHPMALFQPFQKIMVSLTGKSDLLTLKNIELMSDTLVHNWVLKGKSLYCAYYMNELLLRLLPSHTDCQAIFACYQQTLNALAHCSDLKNRDESQETLISYEAPLRFFELNLLEKLGYALNLTNEVSSGLEIDAHSDYFYIMELGPSLVKIPAVKQLKISGHTLIKLADGQFNDQKTLQESKPLLKWAINEQLGNRPLKSRELFKQLYS